MTGMVPAPSFLRRLPVVQKRVLCLVQILLEVTDVEVLASLVLLK